MNRTSERRESLSLSMQPSLKEELDALSRQINITRSQFIDRIFKFFLDLRTLDLGFGEQEKNVNDVFTNFWNFYELMKKLPRVKTMLKEVFKEAHDPLKKPLIYVSHPYTARNGFSIQENLDACNKICNELLDLEQLFISPIIPNHSFDQEKEREPIFWYDYDLELLDKCDVILMCPGWQDSKGCRVEYRYAKNKQIKIIEYKNGWKEELLK